MRSNPGRVATIITLFTLFVVSMSAPRSKRRRTVSTRPSRAALMRGVFWYYMSRHIITKAILQDVVTISLPTYSVDGLYVSSPIKKKTGRLHIPSMARQVERSAFFLTGISSISWRITASPVNGCIKTPCQQLPCWRLGPEESGRHRRILSMKHCTEECTRANSCSTTR